MESFFVGVLVKQVREGKRAENGFKKEAWVAAQRELNSTHGCFLDIIQLKTKCGGKSGAGRCDCRGVVVAGWCCWRWYTAKI